MALTEKQYESLRTRAIADARAKGVSEKQLENYDGELFPGEREYLIRMNPRGKKSAPPSMGTVVLVMGVLGMLITLL